MPNNCRLDYYEGLCRIIYDPPGITYCNQNGITSAVFKCGRGTSVDRFYGRKILEVLTCIIRRKTVKDYTAFAIITAGMCLFENDEIDPVVVIDTPIEETPEEKANPYHSEIFKSYDSMSQHGIPITNAQAKRLARRSFPISIEIAAEFME
jgi:hypothetical protein